MGSPLTFTEELCAEVGVEWGVCVIIPYSVAGKRHRANSGALLIAQCLVGLPYISHTVTHMQRGAEMGVWRGDCPGLAGNLHAVLTPTEAVWDCEPILPQ